MPNFRIHTMVATLALMLGLSLVGSVGQAGTARANLVITVSQYLVLMTPKGEHIASLKNKQVHSGDHIRFIVTFHNIGEKAALRCMSQFPLFDGLDFRSASIGEADHIEFAYQDNKWTQTRAKDKQPVGLRWVFKKPIPAKATVVNHYDVVVL